MLDVGGLGADRRDPVPDGMDFAVKFVAGSGENVRSATIDIGPARTLTKSIKSQPVETTAPEAMDSSLIEREDADDKVRIRAEAELSQLIDDRISDVKAAMHGGAEKEEERPKVSPVSSIFTKIT